MKYYIAADGGGTKVQAVLYDRIRFRTLPRTRWNRPRTFSASASSLPRNSGGRRRCTAWNISSEGLGGIPVTLLHVVIQFWLLRKCGFFIGLEKDSFRPDWKSISGNIKYGFLLYMQMILCCISEMHTGHYQVLREHHAPAPPGGNDGIQHGADAADRHQEHLCVVIHPGLPVDCPRDVHGW